jgi:hypothetical protein
MTFFALVVLVTTVVVAVAAGIGWFLPATKALDAPARIGVPLTFIVSATAGVALVMATVLDRTAGDCEAAAGRDAAFGIAFFTLPLVVIAFVLGLVSRDTRRLASRATPAAFVAGVVDVIALVTSFHLCFTF